MKEYKQIIEGLLYIWGDALDISDIAEIIELDKKETRKILDEMIEEYKENRGLLIKRFGNNYQIVTKSEYYDYYTKLVKPDRKPKLTNSSMEALAIVAYKQPVTRIEIDNIRGAKSVSPINTLIKRGLIKEAGKLDKIGKPIIYKTTDDFLKYFDLKSLDDLPKLDELEEKEKEFEKQMEMDDYENK